MGGMGRKHRKWTRKDLKNIKDMYLKGVSKSEIARQYQVTYQTINNRLIEMGVRRSNDNL